MTHYKRFIRFSLVAVAIFLFANASHAQIEAGKPAPDFDLEQFGGGSITLSQFNGKPVFLYFFGAT